MCGQATWASLKSVSEQDAEVLNTTSRELISKSYALASIMRPIGLEYG
jgi:hypothetical protein